MSKPTLIFDSETFDAVNEQRRKSWIELENRLRNGESLVIARDKLASMLDGLRRNGKGITLVCAVSGDSVSVMATPSEATRA